MKTFGNIPKDGEVFSLIVTDQTATLHSDPRSRFESPRLVAEIPKWVWCEVNFNNRVGKTLSNRASTDKREDGNTEKSLSRAGNIPVGPGEVTMSRLFGSEIAILFFALEADLDYKFTETIFQQWKELDRTECWWIYQKASGQPKNAGWRLSCFYAFGGLSKGPLMFL